MESVHQQIFFMSCDALKKTKNKEKKKKNQWPQPKSAFFLMHCNVWTKKGQALYIVWCLNFFHIEIYTIK